MADRSDPTSDALTPDAMTPDALAELVVRYLNGPVTDAEVAALNRCLADHEWARRTFVRFARLHGLLAEHAVTGRQAVGRQADAREWDLLADADEAGPAAAAGGAAAEGAGGLSLHDAVVQPALRDDGLPPARPSHVPPPAPAPPRPPGRWDALARRWPVGLAAALALAAGVAVWHRAGGGGGVATVAQHAHAPAPPATEPAVPPTVPPVSPPPAPVVTVTLAAAVGADVRGDDGRPLVVGQPMPTGPVDVRRGWVRIDFSTGAAVVAEAPARLRVASGSAVNVTAGRVTALVPPAARGFAVDAPFCHVVDLGTEFGVAVAPAGPTDVAVFRGSVTLARPTPTTGPTNGPTTAAAPQVVAQGQGRRVAATGPAVATPVVAARFVRRDQFDRWAAAAAPTATAADRARAADEQLCRDPSLALFYSFADRATGPALFNRAAATVGRYDLPLAGGHLPTWADGRLPGLSALAFDAAAEQRLLAPDYPVSTNGTLTCCAWVYCRSHAFWASIAKNWQDTGGSAFHFGLNGSDGDLEIQLDGETDGGPRVREGADHPFPLNRWTHVAFATDGQTVRLFRDGRVVATGPSRPLTAAVPVRSLAIGFKTGDDGTSPSTSGAAGYWDGRIGDLALFHRALTLEEVARLADSNPAPTPGR